MGTDDHMSEDSSRPDGRDANVIRIREWLGQDEELVPFGPRADALRAEQERRARDSSVPPSDVSGSGAPGASASGASGARASASGFWEGDASIHTAVPGPGVALGPDVAVGPGDAVGSGGPAPRAPRSRPVSRARGLWSELLWAVSGARAALLTRGRWALVGAIATCCAAAAVGLIVVAGGSGGSRPDADHQSASRLASTGSWLDPAKLPPGVSRSGSNPARGLSKHRAKVGSREHRSQRSRPANRTNRAARSPRAHRSRVRARSRRYHDGAEASSAKHTSTASVTTSPDSSTYTPPAETTPPADSEPVETTPSSAPAPAPSSTPSPSPSPTPSSPSAGAASSSNGGSNTPVVGAAGALGPGTSPDS